MPSTVDFIETMRALQANPALQKYSENKLVKWYRTQIEKLKITEFTTQLGNDFTSQGELRSNRPKDGSLNLFFYSPKHKNKLPYYDRFPLIMPIQRFNASYRGNKKSGAGFIGLNFHYLPYVMRFKLLTDIIPRGRLDGSVERVFVRYPDIKSIQLARPVIKRYLLENVHSDYRYFRLEDYMTILMAPIEDFAKAGKTQVWSDSRRIAVGDKP